MARRVPAHRNLPPLTDARRGERLQRVMADAGVAARRDCEQLILDGHVTVNGEVVATLPVWVNPRHDRILVRGRPLPERERHVYLMLNKPANTLTTAADEPGANRRTVMDLVKHPSNARVFPVGRLDYDTTGLLLLTNDGDLANAISHPRLGLPKTYLAVIKGRLDDAQVAELEEGIYLAERKEGRTVGAVRTARVKVEVFSRGRDRTVLRLILKEGRNRQVRRMLAAVGHPVKKLERVALGPLNLTGLTRGNWRELTRDELRAIRQAVKPASGGTDAETPRLSRRERAIARAAKEPEVPASQARIARKLARPTQRPTSKPAAASTEPPADEAGPGTPREPRRRDVPAGKQARGGNPGQRHVESRGGRPNAGAGKVGGPRTGASKAAGPKAGPPKSSGQKAGPPKGKPGKRPSGTESESLKPARPAEEGPRRRISAPERPKGKD